MIVRALLLLFLGTSTIFSGEEITAHGLVFTQFDDTGNLTRKLEATAAGGSFLMPTLGGGSVTFFAGAGDVAGKLKFADAVFKRQDQRIAGKGAVEFSSPRGTVAAEGFDYDLVTDRLALTSRVIMHIPAAVIKGTRGDITFVKSQRAGQSVVATAILSQGVEVTELKGAEFDRAETAEARYDAQEGTLALSSPVTTWKGGKRGTLSAQTMVFQVHEPTTPPGAKAPSDAPTARPVVVPGGPPAR